MLRFRKLLPSNLKPSMLLPFQTPQTSLRLNYRPMISFSSNDPRLKQNPQPGPKQEEDSRSVKMMKFVAAVVLGLSASYYSFGPKRGGDKQGSKKEEKNQEAEEEAPQPKIKDLSVNIGGSWKLVDLNGKPFTDEDVKGYNYLIYFGFCNCPDVCPQSLHKITDAIKILRKQGVYDKLKLKTIFVSLDPDRDTKERMEQFLKLFDKDIIGLRGKSNEDLEMKEMMKKFRIFNYKIELEGNPDSKGVKPYTYDHTVITYLMNDKNKCLKHFSQTMEGDDIAAEVVRALGKK